MGTLTVREHINFSATLRLPQATSKWERQKAVDTVLSDLGITHVANTRVGSDFTRGISGGERKRTSIGMELILSPDVLFLDEPTTGLDAFTAIRVIELIHR
jgi:ATP-binding cassette subfamily G (WHITE) protein 2